MLTLQQPLVTLSLKSWEGEGENLLFPRTRFDSVGDSAPGAGFCLAGAGLPRAGLGCSVENGSFFLQLHGTIVEDVKTEAAASFAKLCPRHCFHPCCCYGRQEPYPAKGRGPCVLGF